MKYLILMILLFSNLAAASETWTVFSKTKVNSGSADFTKTLSCQFARTFTGTYTTSIIFRLDKANPNTPSHWYTLLLDKHQPSLFADGKRQDMCDLVDELHNIKYGDYTNENTVYTDGKYLKEVLIVTFQNGLSMTSEAKYEIRK